MKFRKKSGGVDKVEQQMTPMIDIVFQLLTFFVMSFKIASEEGDFNVKMPLAQASAGPPTENAPPLQLRLTADAAGRLNGMAFNSKPIGLQNGAKEAFRALNVMIIDMLGKSGPGMADTIELELDCDYGLHYSNVVSAITAASGTVDSNGHVVKLIEKIKFAPPRPG